MTMAAMPSDELATRIRTAARSCPDAVSGAALPFAGRCLRGPGAVVRRARIEEWDVYGESARSGGSVGLVELFGVEAAAFFPTGIMAQQAALRVHTDRAGVRRVALPDLSHLLLHEEDGPRLLHGLEISLLTRGFEARRRGTWRRYRAGWRCSPNCLARGRPPAADLGRPGPALRSVPLLRRCAALRRRAPGIEPGRSCRRRRSWRWAESPRSVLNKGSAAWRCPAGAGPTSSRRRGWWAPSGGTVYHLTAEAVSASWA